MSESMARYKSHKEVSAFKIGSIVPMADGVNLLYGELAGMPPVPVSKAYVDAQHPQIGGYYLVDDDGTELWLPAEVFELEYTRL